MIFVIFHIFWISVCFAGKWSEWQDASLCTAKPCGCPWDRYPCQSGTKVQIRYCSHTGSDVISPSAFDKDGQIRKIDCKAKPGDNCPGWSEWKPITDCICEPYEEIGRQQMRRLCNNPAPIYGDKLCAAVDGLFVNVEKTEKDCTCTNIVTTTSTETPDDVRMCCCEIEGFDDNYESESEYKWPLLGRRRRRQAWNFPDYSLCKTKEEDPNCCKGITTPKPQQCCCELVVVDDYSDCITNEVDPNCCKPKNYDNY